MTNRTSFLPKIRVRTRFVVMINDDVVTIFGVPHFPPTLFRLSFVDLTGSDSSSSGRPRARARWRVADTMSYELARKVLRRVLCTRRLRVLITRTSSHSDHYYCCSRPTPFRNANRSPTRSGSRDMSAEILRPRPCGAGFRNVERRPWARL